MAIPTTPRDHNHHRRRFRVRTHTPRRPNPPTRQPKPPTDSNPPPPPDETPPVFSDTAGTPTITAGAPQTKPNQRITAAYSPPQHARHIQHPPTSSQSLRTSFSFFPLFNYSPRSPATHGPPHHVSNPIPSTITRTTTTKSSTTTTTTTPGTTSRPLD